MSDTTAKCPKCGAPAGAGQKFCNRCGSSLQQVGGILSQGILPPFESSAYLSPRRLQWGRIAFTLLISLLFLLVTTLLLLTGNRTHQSDDPSALSTMVAQATQANSLTVQAAQATKSIGVQALVSTTPQAGGGATQVAILPVSTVLPTVAESLPTRDLPTVVESLPTTTTEPVVPIVAPVRPTGTRHPASSTQVPTPRSAATRVPTRMPQPTYTKTPTHTPQPAPTGSKPVSVPTTAVALTNTPQPTSTQAIAATHVKVPSVQPTSVPAIPATARPVPTSAPSATTQPVINTPNRADIADWTVTLDKIETRKELGPVNNGLTYIPRGIFWLITVTANNNQGGTRSMGDTLDFLLKDKQGTVYTELSNHGKDPLNRQFAQAVGLDYLDTPVPSSGATRTLLLFDIPPSAQPAELIGRIIVGGDKVSSTGQVRFSLAQR
ncbi:MAG: hypothetical protein M3014_00305 [Chloroflexota bacterium]|nr:hypothetical protein [Chloroflexota bacterium]